MNPGHTLTGPNASYLTSKIQVQQIDPRGEFPNKESETQIGRYIYLIARKDSRAEDDSQEINYFNTGLSLSPPAGHYLELVGLPELLKQGYYLPGPIIIGPDNTTEVVVPLYKFRETAEDITLPFRALRLIVRPAVYAHLQRVASVRSSYDSSLYTPDFDSGPYTSTPVYRSDPTTSVTSVYGRGVPRPHAAPPKGNHMF